MTLKWWQHFPLLSHQAYGRDTTPCSHFHLENVLAIRVARAGGPTLDQLPWGLVFFCPGQRLAESFEKTTTRRTSPAAGERQPPFPALAMSGVCQEELTVKPRSRPQSQRRETGSYGVLGTLLAWPSGQPRARRTAVTDFTAAKSKGRPKSRSSEA